MSDNSESTQTRIETRRTISPYDLTSGDNPGTLISKPLLRGPNYDEWSTNIRLALKARKKFGFADGTLPQPAEISPDYEEWVANNALVVSWIQLTIDERLASTLSYTDDANELWMHIQERFGVKNGLTSSTIQRLNLRTVAKRVCPLRFTTVDSHSWAYMHYN